MKGRFGGGTVVLMGALAVMLTVALAEFSLRWVAPVNQQKGVSLRVKQDLPGLRSEILYERDAMGLRRLTLDPDHKPSGSIRVLCIGASTTDQPTQETSDTWCGLLQSRLAKEFSSRGVAIETASFAQGGWRVPDLVARVTDRLDALRPDIVVMLMGINDLAFNGGPDYVYAGLKSRVDSILDRDETAKSGLRGRCEEVSQLCLRVLLLKDSFYNWRHRQEGQSLEWHSRNLPNLRSDYQRYHYVEAPQRNPDPLREFEDGIDAILALLDARGIMAVVLGQPVLWKANMSEAEQAALWFFIETPAGRVRPSGQWLEHEMRRFNAAQKAVAQRHGARFFDLDARIPKDLDHYFDDCHFTDRGSRRVAEEIAPELAAAVDACLATSCQTAFVQQ